MVMDSDLIVCAKVGTYFYKLRVGIIFHELHIDCGLQFTSFGELIYVGPGRAQGDSRSPTP